MEYYRLIEDTDKPVNKWRLGSIISENKRSIWDYVTVKEIFSDEILELTIRKNGNPADVTMADFEVLIVSEKLKNLISVEEAQFIPVKIQGFNNSIEYFLIYIKNEYDCVDEQSSIFDKFEIDDAIRPDKAGQYKTIYQLKIKFDALDNANIFRVKGYNVAVIISGDLKQKMDELSVSGVLYQKVSN